MRSLPPLLSRPPIRYLYDLESHLKRKLLLWRTIYGATDLEISRNARKIWSGFRRLVTSGSLFHRQNPSVLSSALIKQAITRGLPYRLNRYASLQVPAIYWC